MRRDCNTDIGNYASFATPLLYNVDKRVKIQSELSKDTFV